MDDILIAPSEFLTHSKYQCQNISRKININHKTDNETQTDRLRTSDKYSLTTEQIFSGNDVKMKMKMKKEKYLNEVNVLKQKYEERILSFTEESADLLKKLSEVVREKECVNDELSKLRKYINGVENREVWLTERSRLVGEIDRLQYTISDQQNMIDSLRIQLSGMEKIQSIQEQVLNKDIIVNQRFSNNSKSQLQFESILGAWRHKVLSLLVQQESAEIVARNEKQLFHEKHKETLHEMEHLHNSFQQINLRLEVCQAQISTSDILVEKFKRENVHLRSELNEVLNEQQGEHEQIEFICEQMNVFRTFVEEEIFNTLEKANFKIDGFNRRLDFAMSRFPMIEANIKRYKNMNKEEFVEDCVEEYKDNFNHLKLRQLEEALMITSKELKVVREERDRLIVTLEDDSATFHDRVNKRKEELKDEMEHLKGTVLKYETSLSKVSKDLDLLKQENYRLKADYDILLSSKHAEVEDLHLSLKDTRKELSRLSQELSEVKRIGAKGKKEMEDELSLNEERLKACDNHWRNICDQLTVERDLLKMTIRQDGIINKYKTRSLDQSSRKEKSSEKQGSGVDDLMQELNQLAGELNDGR